MTARTFATQALAISAEAGEKMCTLADQAIASFGQTKASIAAEIKRTQSQVARDRLREDMAELDGLIKRIKAVREDMAKSDAEEKRLRARIARDEPRGRRVTPKQRRSSAR